MPPLTVVEEKRKGGFQDEAWLVAEL